VISAVRREQGEYSEISPEADQGGVVESGFNVDLNELRGHAATVFDIAGQVRSAGAGAQDLVGGAFGQIAEFFASGVTAAGDELRGAISQAGDTVVDVHVGLRQTADSYQNTDDRYATVFGGGNSGSGGQRFAQLMGEGVPATPDVGSVNGRYGDDRTGWIGSASDVADRMMAPGIPERVARLTQVESHIMVPDPESRLGAFAGTRGYPHGTVGNAVHLGIAAIYMYLGDAGQEKNRQGLQLAGSKGLVQPAGRFGREPRDGSYRIRLLE